MPESPVLNAAVGRQQTFYIWAQPATDSLGIRVLQDFSLDIVTQTAALQPEPEPFIDFVDGTFKVYNEPVVSGKQRFQYTTDSLRIDSQGGPLLSDRTSDQVLAGQPDAIKGLQGFSLVNNNVVGIGNNGDPNCTTINNCSAWRVAEFSIIPLQPSGTNVNLVYLQIGFAGMVSDRAGDTEVLLGNNSIPIYDASATNHRQVTLANDSFDLQVTAVPFSPGDYNSDGAVGIGDYIFWRSTFGQSVRAGEGADGDQNGVVDARDYVFWRNAVALGSGSSILKTSSLNMIIPEPGTGAFTVVLFFGSTLLPHRRRRSI